ncbi:MAG: Stp1/IreP family PP2C-type Ser/Thr phosphatase [Actinomycetota bacterium]
MRTTVGYKSDVGQVRQGNEDSFLVQEPFFAVADGMGGHVAGDIASQTAIETIAGGTQDGATRDPSVLEGLIKAANGAIWEKAQDDPALHGMGTTCTLVLVDDSQVHIGHVGDSRAYLFRGGDLSQLTEDHTLVARMVKEGRLQPEEAERHPQRSIITRTLGVDPEVQVDTSSLPVQEGDRILICSDGLTSMIDAGDISDVLSSVDDPQQAVDRLVDLANDAGGEDNVTTVIIDFHEGSSSSAGASVATTLRTEDRRTTQEQARVDTAPDVDADANTRAVDVREVEEQLTVPRAEHAPVAPVGRAIVAPKKRSAWRPVISLLLIVAVLAIGGYIFFRYVVVANSYFVGATDAGRVAIYQGLPEDVMGVSFQEQEEVTTVRVDELPIFLQEDVENGIEAESLGDARQTVTNLEQRARDEEFQDRARDKKEKGSNNT